MVPRRYSLAISETYTIDGYSRHSDGLWWSTMPFNQQDGNSLPILSEANPDIPIASDCDAGTIIRNPPPSMTDEDVKTLDSELRAPNGRVQVEIWDPRERIVALGDPELLGEVRMLIVRRLRINGKTGGVAPPEMFFATVNQAEGLRQSGASLHGCLNQVQTSR